jgi:sugar lactone lactonase YvrE
MSDTTVFISGLHFAEGPRWHDGALYFSDFYAHSVYRADDNGDLTQLATIDQQPSGLGWLPNGDLLVVSMIDRSVVRVREGHDPEPYADLRSATTFLANDMLVDPAGRAYVGNFGFDLHTYINTHGIEALMTGGATATTLALVNADGSVEVAAEEMMFPNGMALTADRSTLIVAETLALRLTAFDLDADGRLHNRRVWADLSSELAAPDGICIDANDRVWVANALGPQAIRVEEGGAVTGRVSTQQICYAVAVGGTDGDTLFCCTAPDSDATLAASARNGCIETARI